MNRTCLIISGGTFSPLPENFKKPDFIIACDHGYQYAETLGLTPDLIIGDFDSAPEPETDIPVIRVPTRKDDTDTMLAIKKALDQGFSDITIICAFGGRMDHTFANIQSGAYIAAHGGTARLCGIDTDMYIFRDSSVSLPRRTGWSLSVFSLSDKCSGVSVSGTKYECENAELTNTFPLGTSNVWNEKEAVIRVKHGILMVIESRLKEGEHI